MALNIYLLISLTGIISVCFLHTAVSAEAGKSVFVFGGEKLRGKRSERVGETRPDIAEFLITSRVESRFATVVVFSRVKNKNKSSKEASFVVQIPETAFISKFSMVINGTTHLAKVYEKKEAQKKYDDAKKQGQSAGQVSHQGRTASRGMDIFNINVNVAANSEVSFEVTYQELLERRQSKYIQRFRIQPLQIVPRLMLNAGFEETQGFREFSFQLPNSAKELTTSEGNAKLQATPTSRKIVYSPSVDEQKTFDIQKGIDGEFIVTYDVNFRTDGGYVLVKENCFNHYMAPSRLLPLGKNIVFLIDVSGSMSGDKIRQARESLLVILAKLRPEDVFNILVFSTSVRRWRLEPQNANSTNIKMATDYVNDYVVAGGGTNIYDALLEAVESLINSFSLPGVRANLIVFLTDGEPTEGVTDKRTIRSNVLEANGGEKKIGIFSLAFGFNLNIDFLKALSWENGGFARRIYAEQDADSQLTNFYNEIQNPVLVNVDVRYDINVVDPNDVTKTNYLQYFDGTELVIAGKTKVVVDRPNTMNISVIGMAKHGRMELDVVSRKLVMQDESFSTCKLYAYLKIKDLLRQKAIAKTEEEAGMFEQKALDLSLQYGFVTPLTSLVVVQDDEVKQMGTNHVSAYADSTRFIMPNVLLCYLSYLISVVTEQMMF